MQRTGSGDGGSLQANFVWDHQNLHMKTDSTSNDFYAYEPRLFGNLVWAGTSNRWFHFDKRGSTALLTDPGGTFVDMYTYSPWGEVKAHSLNTDRNPFDLIR